jgi:hypothetical protein
MTNTARIKRHAASGKAYAVIPFWIAPRPDDRRMSGKTRAATENRLDSSLGIAILYARRWRRTGRMAVSFRCVIIGPVATAALIVEPIATDNHAGPGRLAGRAFPLNGYRNAPNAPNYAKYRGWAELMSAVGRKEASACESY